MIAHDHPDGTVFDGGHRIVGAQHPLHQHRQTRGLGDPTQVGRGEGAVEGGVAVSRQSGPLPGAVHGDRHIDHRHVVGQGESVDLVPTPPPHHREVDGEHHCSITGGPGPGQQVATQATVAVAIELKPLWGAWSRRGHVLDAGGGEGGHHHRGSGPSRGARHRRLAVGVGQSLCRHGSDQDRNREIASHQAGGGVDRGDVTEHVRQELHLTPRRLVGSQRDLVVGSPGVVVEGHRVDVRPCQHLETGGVHGGERYFADRYPVACAS